VVGFEDERGLVTPLAYVALHDGPPAADGGTVMTARLVEHVKAKLAHYKAPRRVEYMDSLPRNDRGKVARAELRKLANSKGAARGRAEGGA
jgi:acyl-coenzyme A synthetase/AMP-(fatty) acid ligase